MSLARSVVCVAATASSLLGCASSEAMGTRSVAILGSGIVNDPANKSLRFDLLKFGLGSFCQEMLAQGAALKSSDEEPVMGRFYATACNSQVLDEPTRKSFVVQYAGSGFAASPQGGRIGFSTKGLVEYAPDFMLNGSALYVYFRPRVVDATEFRTLLVESEFAESALRLLGVSPDAFGRKVVDAQLRRGFTVIRYDDSGETAFGMGIVPLGERPYHPFSVKSEGKRVLINERTEVHLGQQDFMGPLNVEGDSQALYVTAALDGTAAADLLIVPEAAGRTMIDGYVKHAGAAPLRLPALLDEPLVRSVVWKRYVSVPRGKYYLIVDNSSVVGRTAPPPGASDGRSARTDVLVLLGDRP